MIEEYNKILLPIIYKRKYYYKLKRKGIIHHTVKLLTFELLLTIAVLKETHKTAVKKVCRYNDIKIINHLNRLLDLNLIKKKTIYLA